MKTGGSTILPAIIFLKHFRNNTSFLLFYFVIKNLLWYWIYLMWQYWYLFFARFVSISSTYQKAWLWSNFRNSGIVTYLWKMCEREYNQVFRNMPWHCGIYNGIPTTTKWNKSKEANRTSTDKKPEYNLSKARCRQHYNNNNVYGWVQKTCVQ